MAFEWVIKNRAGGLTTEADLPFTGMQDPTCPARLANASFKGAATLSNWTFLSQNETEIAASLAKIGPLSAGLNSASMQHYRSGVSCPIHDICDPKGMNHAVLIVGWGVDPFTMQEYWQIKVRRRGNTRTISHST
jgi:cathepsin F